MTDLLSDECAVESIELTKQFGNFVAVNNLSFKVSKGEIFGMLGPNGSGKSTTIRMLCGLLDPTSGTAYVAGIDVRKDPEYVKSHIGYMSQKFSLYTDLTAEENLRFYAGVYGIQKKEQPKRIAEMIEHAGLQGTEKVLAADLSTGFRQRLALGSAIIHRPQIVFLDEPTSGSDPVSRRRFWDLIYDVTEQGSTVIVTTHYMDEAERCDTVMLMSGGKLIAIGTPPQLKRETIKGSILSISTDKPTEALGIIQSLPDVNDTALYGRSIHAVTTRPEALIERIGEDIPKHGIKILSVQKITPNLEDVFVSLLGHRVNEEGDAE